MRNTFPKTRYQKLCYVYEVIRTKRNPDNDSFRAFKLYEYLDCLHHLKYLIEKEEEYIKTKKQEKETKK